MTWPFDARYVNVVDGATLINADLLNQIQDELIKARSPRKLIVPAELMRPNDDTDWVFSAFNEAVDLDSRWVNLTVTPEPLIIPISLTVGDRVTAVEIFVEQTTATAAQLSARLYQTHGTTPPSPATPKSNAVASAAGTGRQTITLTGITPAAITDGQRYFIVVTPDATGDQKAVYGAQITWDRLIVGP